MQNVNVGGGCCMKGTLSPKSKIILRGKVKASIEQKLVLAAFLCDSECLHVVIVLRMKA